MPTPSPKEPRSAVDSFTADKVDPVSPSLSYRTSLFLVSLVMVALPILYILLIVLIGYAVYWHATEHTGLLNDDVWLLRGVYIPTYLAPIVVGPTLAFFMVKPLFTSRSKHPEDLILRPGDEPELERFINRICDAVNAPRPTVIAVDNRVNASASFEMGWRGWFANRLRLTIGLSMISRMKLDSLGGILAHEFGHFSQGGGMRSGYIIKIVNNWFSRVVYERDKWDEKVLEIWNKDYNWLSVFAMFVGIFVWISRKTLWVLMRLGQLASMNLSRQMEFDADTYEARLVGSATFKESTIQFRILSSAKHSIDETVNQIWHEGKLPQNYPELIGAYASSYSESTHQSVEAHIGEERTKRLDSHPCDKDRIEHVDRLNAQGIFDDDRPARDLFVDFDKLSERSTRHQYGILAGIDLKQVDFVSSSAVLEERMRADKEEEAFNTFTNGFMSCHLEYKLDAEHPYMPPIELCQFIHERIVFISDVPDDAYKTYLDIHELSDGIAAAEAVHSLYLCRQKLTARILSRNTAKDAGSAYEIVQTKRRNYNETKSKATDIANNLSQLFLASKALILPTLEDPERKAEFLAKFTLFEKLLETGSLLLEANVDLKCIEEVLDTWEDEDPKPKDREAVVSKHQPRHKERLSQLEQTFSGFPYPYLIDRSDYSVYQYFTPKLELQNDILRVIQQETETLANRFVNLRAWLAKDICYLAYPLLANGLKAANAAESEEPESV